MTKRTKQVPAQPDARPDEVAEDAGGYVLPGFLGVPITRGAPAPKPVTVPYEPPPPAPQPSPGDEQR